MAKTIGWLISMAFLIAGLGFAHNMSETGNMEPLGISILCFGIVYWLSRTTYQSSQKVMIGSVAVLVVSGLLANFVVADVIDEYLGWDIGFYLPWVICMLAVGAPVMGYIFKNE
jgi:hypothetical protein